jgi:hypothetical protein
MNVHAGEHATPALIAENAAVVRLVESFVAERSRGWKRTASSTRGEDLPVGGKATVNGPVVALTKQRLMLLVRGMAA